MKFKQTFETTEERLGFFADAKGYQETFFNDEGEEIDNPESKEDFAIKLVKENTVNFLNGPYNKQIRSTKRQEEKELVEENIALIEDSLTVEKI